MGTAEEPSVGDWAWRPAIHFTAPTNWLNDPCGLVWWDGAYHLFYQHNPQAPEFGPMHWAHAVGTDLFRWRDAGIALEPTAEAGMAFTGSAVWDRDNRSGLFDNTEGGGLVVLFTRAAFRSSFHDTYQEQCLASSTDGYNWTEHGVVIPNPGLRDFRDPKVGFYTPPGKMEKAVPGTGDKAGLPGKAGETGEAGHWFLVLAAGDEVWLYTSGDLVNWELAGSFGRGRIAQTGIWECPDLFEVPVETGSGESGRPRDQAGVSGDNGASERAGDRPRGQAGEQQTKWVMTVHLGHGLDRDHAGAFYITGQFDGRRFRPDEPMFRAVDQGHDFYAAQTWANLGQAAWGQAAPEGAARGQAAPDQAAPEEAAPVAGPLWIAWANHPQYAQKTPTRTWRGTLSLPRQLSLRRIEGRHMLIQRPPEGAVTVRFRRVPPTEVGGDAKQTGRRRYDVAASERTPISRAYELVIEDAGWFFVSLEYGGAGVVTITCDPAGGAVEIDRSHCDMGAFSAEIDPVKTVTLPGQSPEPDRIFIDRSILECFFLGGLLVTTDLLFPVALLERVIVDTGGPVGFDVAAGEIDRQATVTLFELQDVMNRK